MRLPRIFRTTPFRLTLLFLALFTAAASLFLAYIYIATAGEATRRTDQDIRREMRSLVSVYDRAGVDAMVLQKAPAADQDGAAFDPAPEGKIRVSVVATGMDDPAAARATPSAASSVFDARRPAPAQTAAHAEPVRQEPVRAEASHEAGSATVVPTTRLVALPNVPPMDAPSPCMSFAARLRFGFAHACCADRCCPM